MHVTVITLFPEMFRGPFDFSIIKRARDKKILNLAFVNLRDFAVDKRGSVDDHPYGGGEGMILRVDVVDRAISSVKLNDKLPNTRIILLDPKGKSFTQKTAIRLTKYSHLVTVCGHYEGFDDRVRNFVDETISLGDFILSGGELGAMVIIDTVVRLLPGTLASRDAVRTESFTYGQTDETSGLLEYPQFTQPREYKGLKVPEILFSGDHKKISLWRSSMAQTETQKHRPDLLTKSKT